MQGPGGVGPLCPACISGRLHPYKVEISLGPLGYEGVGYLDGWVAICRGEEDQETGEELVPPCGFSMPMTAHPRLGAR